jgi:hypothetical protein
LTLKLFFTEYYPEGFKSPDVWIILNPEGFKNPDVCIILNPQGF